MRAKGQSHLGCRTVQSSSWLRGRDDASVTRTLDVSTASVFGTGNLASEVRSTHFNRAIQNSIPVAPACLRPAGRAGVGQLPSTVSNTQ
jgi:hypothetical protein